MLLSSRSDPLVIAYHVTSMSPIRSLCPPYTVPMHVAKHIRPLNSLAAMTFGKHMKPSSSFLLFAQSSDAALWSFTLTSERDPSSQLGDTATQQRRIHAKRKMTSVRWNADVEALLQDTPSKDQVDKKAMTRHREIDCRWAWMSTYLGVSLPICNWLIECFVQVSTISHVSLRMTTDSRFLILNNIYVNRMHLLHT